MKIEHIIKRDFTTRVYDLNKITGAIEKAMSAVGVGNKQTFNAVVKYSKGAIIGSAFIKNLHENGIDSIASYIDSIR